MMSVLGARAAHRQASGLLPTFQRSWSFHIGRAQLFICDTPADWLASPLHSGLISYPYDISSPPVERIINIEQVNTNRYGGRINLSGISHANQY